MSGIVLSLRVTLFIIVSRLKNSHKTVSGGNYKVKLVRVERAVEGGGR